MKQEKKHSHMNKKDIQDIIADPFEGKVIDAEEMIARNEAMLEPLKPLVGKTEERKQDDPDIKNYK